MKKIGLYFTLILFSLFLSNCSDPCKDIDCNNGTCDDGTCICDDGFTGANCDTELRAPFLGTFEGDLDCPDAPFDLGMVGFGSLTVITEGDPDDIFGIVITTPSLPFSLFSTGTIDGNSLTLASTSTEIDLSGIPDNPLPFDSLPITTTGSGELDGDNIVINVNIIIPLLGTISCTSVLTRL